MFGIGRRARHRDLVKTELRDGIGHFAQAAAHAREGVGSTVAPRVGAAKDYVAPKAAKVRGGAQRRWGSTMAAIAPLAVAADGAVRQAGSAARKGNLKDMGKKKSKGRLSKGATVLALGAAVGAAGAFALRRRRDNQEWHAYDPAATLTGVSKDPAGQTERDLARSASTARETNTATMAPEKAHGDKLASATDSITETAKQGASKTTESAKRAAGANGKSSDETTAVIGGSATTASRKSNN
ncbi:hypothetical protein [Plantactinospora sp. GCM10030261]|uniref:hypothetical protein n=1 Tax=Plantactinospora sp. GCM10030261 TaxID=3273420 RepID=UPI003611A217